LASRRRAGRRAGETERRDRFRPRGCSDRWLFLRRSKLHLSSSIYCFNVTLVMGSDSDRTGATVGGGGGLGRRCGRLAGLCAYARDGGGDFGAEAGVGSVDPSGVGMVSTASAVDVGGGAARFIGGFGTSTARKLVD
jgi:hypothetical protein